MQVTTITGKTVDKSKCRNISGVFYQIGNIDEYESGECYFLRNQYYRSTSSNLVWLIDEQKYVDKRHTTFFKYSEALYGYKNGQLGYFKYDWLNTFVVFSSNIEEPYYYVASVKDAEELGLEYSRVYDIYLEKDFDKRSLKKAYRVYTENTGKGYRYLNQSSYNIAESPNLSFINNNITFDEAVPSILQDVFDLLGGHSFGIEAETSKGVVPERICVRNGYSPLKDGSIGGIEYTSVPFATPVGLIKTRNFLESAKEICSIDKFCSLHVHIGNVIPKSEWKTNKFKLKTLAIYMLYYHIQREIFEMIPGYKKSLHYFKEKKEMKDHCADLPSLGFYDNDVYNAQGNLRTSRLDFYFERLFKFWNCGMSSNEYTNFKNRHFYEEGTAKWNIKSRYHALNMFNLFFKECATVEFRAHHATLNSTKTIAWLLICNAILRYATLNYESIIKREVKLTLSDIIECYRDNFGKGSHESYEFIADYLKNYIHSRKQDFLSAFFNNDLYANEFARDSKFDFVYNKKSLNG